MSDLSTESQVEVFHTIFEKYRKTLRGQLSQKNNENYSKADWFLIQNQREAGEIDKPHVLEKSWTLFEQYFLSKNRLFYFIEAPIRGLVNKEAKFWLFFDAPLAAAYFKRQQDRPKNFSKKNIANLPCPPLFNPITAGFSAIVEDTSLKLVDQIKRHLDLLKIADKFLPEEQSKKIEPMVQKIISTVILREVELLLKDIKNPGISPTILERRLKGIFQIGWRFYR